MQFFASKARRSTRRAWRIAVLLCVALAFSGCSNCADEAQREINIFDPHEYGEWEYDGEPDIDGPERVMFGDVLEGETVTEDVTITNTGRALLKLGHWRIDGRFQLSFPSYADARPGEPAEVPTELLPGESVEARITYVARTTDRAEGLLSIESNDPDEPTFEVELYANADFPCLALEPADRIDFGTVELGEAARRFIRARNCAQRSPTTFSVSSLEAADEYEILDPAIGDEIELQPGEVFEIAVTFRPQTPGDYDGVVYIDSDDELEPQRMVELTGKGKPYDCPEAVIRAYHPDRGEALADPVGELAAVPLDTIELDASFSRDPEGSGIERVEWRLVQRPPDSTSGLTSPDGVENSLWMQLAGTYEVELNVWNGLGVKSCEPARMTLKSIADEDIHIQLVWNTPNDPDETDSSGADVDVHLLHPNANGIWNLPPWDCFWQNQTPDWGRPGVDEDDPSLDIDDIDGAGPENINLNNPEVDTKYNVGVYYFSDHSWGMSYATVRIYIGGQLALEAQRKPMRNQEFWWVADIDWPGGVITERDDLYRSFPRGD